MHASPSCMACKGYWDYGKELEEEKKDAQNFYIGGNELALHVEKLRLLYTELFSLSYEMSRLFGSHLVRDYLFSIFGLILYTYILLFANLEGSVSNYVIITVLDGFLILKLFVLSYVAERISNFVR